jgi:ABC-type nitrate/sulfonate/bicarbonate transport system substrate-binding protein
MNIRATKLTAGHIVASLLAMMFFSESLAGAADKLVGIHSARVMSQSMPWMAQEAGLFKKYNLDFSLVFISSSGIVTAALLGGDAEMTVTGGLGDVRLPHLYRENFAVILDGADQFRQFGSQRVQHPA